VKLGVVNLDFGAPGPLSHLERGSSGRRPESSVPLGKGTTGGVVRTNENPLPQKTRRSFLKASIPLNERNKNRTDRDFR